MDYYILELFNYTIKTKEGKTILEITHISAIKYLLHRIKKILSQREVRSEQSNIYKEKNYKDYEHLLAHPCTQALYTLAVTPGHTVTQCSIEPPGHVCLVEDPESDPTLLTCVLSDLSTV